MNRDVTIHESGQISLAKPMKAIYIWCQNSIKNRPD